MHDPALLIGAVAAGLMCGGSVLIAARPGFGPPDWLSRRAVRSAISQAMRVTGARDRLATMLERAGWNETPERACAFAIALAACLAVLGASSGALLPTGTAITLSLLGIGGGLGVPYLALKSAVDRRRTRLEAELVPLLELLALELSGGGSALSALGSITMQVQGELASDLRRLLIAAHVAGSTSFESKLIEYSELLEIPAIGSLATIIAASREYGTGVVQGVRALATDLRRAQRRELIAHSRRALNHVLLPAAIGVLLPFLAVLMFPAVSALQRSLR
jgi:Flp pilus assembly protein TadB